MAGNCKIINYRDLIMKYYKKAYNIIDKGIGSDKDLDRYDTICRWEYNDKTPDWIKEKYF